MIEEEEAYYRQKHGIVINQAGLNVESTHMMARGSLVAYPTVNTTKITYILNYMIIQQQQKMMLYDE
jgi:hypothetical protein